MRLSAENARSVGGVQGARLGGGLRRAAQVRRVPVGRVSTIRPHAPDRASSISSGVAHAPRWRRARGGVPRATARDAAPRLSGQDTRRAASGGGAGRRSVSRAPLRLPRPGRLGVLRGHRMGRRRVREATPSVRSQEAPKARVPTSATPSTVGDGPARATDDGSLGGFRRPYRARVGPQVLEPRAAPRRSRRPGQLVRRRPMLHRRLRPRRRRAREHRPGAPGRRRPRRPACGRRSPFKPPSQPSPAPTHPARCT